MLVFYLTANEQFWFRSTKRFVKCRISEGRISDLRFLGMILVVANRKPPIRSKLAIKQSFRTGTDGETLKCALERLYTIQSCKRGRNRSSFIENWKRVFDLVPAESTGIWRRSISELEIVICAVTPSTKINKVFSSLYKTLVADRSSTIDKSIIFSCLWVNFVAAIEFLNSF